MWSEGIIASPETGTKYKYWVKHYGEGSEVYGIGGGYHHNVVINTTHTNSS
jgi:hypothetical protein